MDNANTNTNITAGRMADLLCAAVLNRADACVAEAEAVFEPSYIDVAFARVSAGAEPLDRTERLMAEQARLYALYSSMILWRGRRARDRRVGQLELAL